LSSSYSICALATSIFPSLSPLKELDLWTGAEAAARGALNLQADTTGGSWRSDWAWRQCSRPDRPTDAEGSFERCSWGVWGAVEKQLCSVSHGVEQLTTK
jgi:hypothetical protein